MTLGRINAYGTLRRFLCPWAQHRAGSGPLSEAVRACGELTERKAVANGQHGWKPPGDARAN